MTPHSLLDDLRVLDQHLYALLGETMKYRRAVQGELFRLRAGDAPAVVQTRLEQWVPTLRAIRQLARRLTITNGGQET